LSECRISPGFIDLWRLSSLAKLIYHILPIGVYAARRALHKDRRHPASTCRSSPAASLASPGIRCRLSCLLARWRRGTNRYVVYLQPPVETGARTSCASVMQTWSFFPLWTLISAGCTIESLSLQMVGLKLINGRDLCCFSYERYSRGSDSPLLILPLVTASVAMLWTVKQTMKTSIDDQIPTLRRRETLRYHSPPHAYSIPLAAASRPGPCFTGSSGTKKMGFRVANVQRTPLVLVVIGKRRYSCLSTDRSKDFASLAAATRDH
jgi:hypothetical protein